MSKVSSYYDEHRNPEELLPPNRRHQILVDQLKSLGLDQNSSLLELGCGAGQVTYLISKIVTKGSVVAVDISPKRIESARRRIGAASNIHFEVSDLLDFNPPEERYDFITLFDVIEHIPLNDHTKLFERVSGFMDINSRLLINIPNPAFIEYLQEHEPELLQLVDQPVYADALLSRTHKHGLRLRFFITYSVWNHDDYQLILLERGKPFMKTDVTPQKTGFLQKMKKKILPVSGK